MSEREKAPLYETDPDQFVSNIAAELFNIISQSPMQTHIQIVNDFHSYANDNQVWRHQTRVFINAFLEEHYNVSQSLAPEKRTELCDKVILVLEKRYGSAPKNEVEGIIGLDDKIDK